MNMVAGLVVLALLVLTALHKSEDVLARWAGPLGAVGLVALITGSHMTLTWPAPEQVAWANIAFGEMTILLGASFLALAWSAGRRRSLAPVGVYTAVAGVTGIVVGIRIANLGLTQSPNLAAAGFVLAGVGGILLGPTVWMRRSGLARAIEAVILLGAAGIWTLIGLGAYWMHLESFSK
jgi:putative membrane protein